ncbi:DNA repair protein [Cognatishimia sp. MH4019]|uniref:DNA repair protein n=1 Tax=Cognatishimia sp. MH4019 TaxID=2854030 RepID=UPI001CD5BAA7|nr:DNA repair protein [Cognatishimia sp. MH4019]
MDTQRSALFNVQIFMQRISLFLMLTLAFAVIGLTILAAFSILPWLELSLTFGGVTYPWAGMAIQIAFALFALSLCFYLPANGRIMALEKSHREFSLRMDDVARAYHKAHSADRKGLFTLGSEFDSVKERIMHLKNHPDLEELEPEILEIAAQMSHESQELASLYSDEKVDRARNFLRQRQQEVRKLEERIENAKVITREIRHWQQQVEMDESIVASQLRRLQDDLVDVLAPLGLGLMQDDPKVVTMAKTERASKA